jgi:hypothetical protein
MSLREDPERRLPLRRVLEAGQDLAYAHESLLPVRRPLDLEAHAVAEVALGPGDLVLEPNGDVGRVEPRRERGDPQLEPEAGG